MDKTERHLNLVALLMNAERPVELARIRDALYRDQAEEAFKRMFERDKEELRALGLAIEVDEIGSWGDQGYVVRREAATLPDLGLTAAEHAALMLAAGVWGDGMLGQASPRVAGMKIAATNAEPPPVPWILPHVDLRSPQVSTITDAIDARKAITFRYRSSGSVATTERTIEPHALRFRGAWYVTGFDRERGEQRMFKLDRIEGSVKISASKGASFEPPAASPHEPMPGEINDESAQRARVAIDPDLAWWAERRSGITQIGETVDGRIELEVAVPDEQRFIQWVLGFADAAEVLSPPGLRDATATALTAAASHAAGEKRSSSPGKGRG